MSSLATGCCCSRCPSGTRPAAGRRSTAGGDAHRPAPDRWPRPARPERGARRRGGHRGPDKVVLLSEVDPEGLLEAALAARPGEVWIVRPDTHIAAVLTRPTTPELVAALDRALGR